MTVFMILLTILSLMGVVLNIKRRSEGFMFWIVANTGWAYIDFHAGLYAQTFLFSVYTMLAFWGLWSWRQTSRKVAAESAQAMPV